MAEDFQATQQKNEASPPVAAKGSLKLFRWLALIVVIGVSIFIFTISDRINEFAEQIPGLGWFAYPAIFAVSIAANATVIIPVPGVVLTSLFGAVFNPIGVAVAAGMGASLGELSGYLAGFSGQGVIERTKWHDRLYHYIEKHGRLTVLVLGFIPNPLFDLAGMLAGASKMPLPRFLLWCAFGKILKMLMFAYAGDWLASLL